MKRLLLVVALAACDSGAINEADVPESVKQAAYAELLSRGCTRKVDGTWDCPAGALTPEGRATTRPTTAP